MKKTASLTALLSKPSLEFPKHTPRELFSIAPMVDITDKFFRYFMRLLTKKSFLYTEMLNENAILLSNKR
jgi:tRNA-dihydrouridine synthase A